MPPKRAAATSEQGMSDDLKKYAAHPPTMVMVKEAIAELNSRKGSSTQAIRNYVTEKYPSIDSVRLKYLVRQAVVKGVERGEFVRPAKSTFSGAQGTFRLAVKRKAKGPKTASENSDPNVEMAAEPGAKKTKTKKIKDAEEEPVQKRKDPKPKAASKVAPEASGDKSDGEEEPKRKTSSKVAKGTKKEPVKKEKLPTEDSKSKKAPKAGAAASKVVPAKRPKAKRSAEGEVGTEQQKKPRVPRASKAAKDKGAEPKEAAKVAEPKVAKVAEPKVAKKPEVEEEAASTQAAPGRRGKGVKN
ncbi:protein B4 [Osmerus eperlanus]|uniref:protein B4 n=1 Tax=Osmerus eperlanus TaxID=29151 RepID=UPI002E13A258